MRMIRPSKQQSDAPVTVTVSTTPAVGTPAVGTPSVGASSADAPAIGTPTVKRRASKQDGDQSPT